MQAYHDLARDADSGIKVIIVEYEQLVISPEQVVRHVARAMGVGLKGPFMGVTDAAKNHGHARTRTNALSSIVNMNYLREGPWTDIDMQNLKVARNKMCRYFNSTLMAAHQIQFPIDL